MNSGPFDHALLGVDDLSAAVRSFRAAGFRVNVGMRRPGTHSALIAFATPQLHFLELIEIHDRAAMSSSAAGQRFLRVLDEEGVGWLTYGVEHSDVTAAAADMAKAEPAIGSPVPGSAPRPGGALMEWLALAPFGQPWCHPYPFLVEWITSPGERQRLIPAEPHPNGTSGVAGVVVRCDDLERAAQWYEDVMKVPVIDAVAPDGRTPSKRATVGFATVDLVAAHAPWPLPAPDREGLAAVVLAVPDVSRLGGTDLGMLPGSTADRGWSIHDSTFVVRCDTPAG